VKIRRERRSDLIELTRRRRPILAKEAPQPMDEAASSSSSSSAGAGAGVAMPDRNARDTALSTNDRKIPDLKVKSSGIFSDNEAVIAEALAYILRVLNSHQLESITSDLIEFGIVSRLVQLLDRTLQPAVMQDIIVSMINIACSTPEIIAVVCREGALPFLLHHMTSPNQEQRDLALWAVGNLTCVETQHGECLQDLLRMDLLSHLLWLLNKGTMPSGQKPPPPSLQTLRHVAWICMNIVRGPPVLTLSVADACCRMLGELAFSPDRELIAEVFTALSEICQGGDAYIDLVLQQGVLRQLVKVYQEAGVATHAETTDMLTVDVTKNQSVSSTGHNNAPDYQGLAHSKAGNHGLVAANASQLLLRSSAVRMLTAMSRSCDRMQFLVLMNPDIGLLSILVGEIDLHTDTRTSIESCHGLKNCILSAAASDAGFSETLVHSMLSDLASPEIAQLLDAAIRHGHQDLAMASLEVISAITCVTPPSMLVTLLLLGFTHYASFFRTCSLPHSTHVDIGIVKNALSACHRGLSLLALEPQLVNPLSNVVATLPTLLAALAESLGPLETHNNSDISHAAITINEKTMPAALAGLGISQG